MTPVHRAGKYQEDRMVPNTEMYKPLYRQLLERDLAAESTTLCPFFCQAGKEYHNSTPRILFVGKSTNGWVTDSRNIDLLFDKNNEDRIVNRDDQMEWVKTLEGPNPLYNTKKSAFWRVVKRVSSYMFSAETWYTQIAWTNLFKVSPSEGNPSSALRRKQLDTCRMILSADLTNLAPTFVVFLTSEWETEFLRPSGYEIDRRAYRRWANYKTYYAHFQHKVLIHSPHPQGKPENDHMVAICGILRTQT